MDMSPFPGQNTSSFDDMHVTKIAPGIESEDDADDDSGVIAQRLHGFFAGHGLPRHKHASQLAQILGLSRSGAFRKFQDGSFSSGDLETLAQHFEVDVGALLSAQGVAPKTVPQGEPGETHDARLLVGTIAISCRVTVGPVLAAGEHCELVATQHGAQWLVQPWGVADLQARHHRVVQMVVTPTQRALPRVAVLEDSRDLGLNMKDAFEASGFRVELFGSAAELAQRAAAAPFDAYLVDWWLQGQTAGQALQSIRGAQPSVPLVLTTGAIATGHVVEGDIVRLATALRIHVVEKPFRLALVISLVRQLIEQDSTRVA